jgi:hypothetical protein
MAPSSEPRFWIEELAAPARQPRRLSGCELCEHCTLLRLLARERSQPATATEEQP